MTSGNGSDSADARGRTRTLRGLLRASGQQDSFYLLLPEATPTPGVALLPVAAVCGHRVVGRVGDEDLIEVEVDAGTPVSVHPFQEPGILVLGGASAVPAAPADDRRPGVPFILATPHHIDSIRNPETMGGVQPVDPWKGPSAARPPRREGS